MNKNLLLLLVFYFLPFIGTAQNFEFNGDFLLFREAKTKQPVLIVNDSLVYKGFAMKRIAFKHTEYPARLNEYVFFNIGKKTYLVHDGCGPVLEFRNDSIVKINDNYLHHNQFNAVNFVYRNEIYFFGGYGLFTTKNILTKYNFITKDWIEIQTHSEKSQEPRSSAYGYLKGDNLYVFSGGAKDNRQITSTRLSDNKVWRLNLPKMQWDCEGEYNIIPLKIDVLDVFSDSKKLYFQSRQFFSEFDYYSNRFYTYDRNYFPYVLSSYLEDKTIVGVYKAESKTFFHAGDISEFKGKLKSTSVFITPLDDYTYCMRITLTSLLLLILLLYLFKSQLMSIFMPFKGILYNSKKDNFTYKRKTILFEEQEKLILFYLFDHLNQYISLNELNQLFEKNKQPETISATVKRREQAVSGLVSKVSKICGIEENKLILERKNSTDKRIKDILLLPNLLKTAN